MTEKTLLRKLAVIISLSVVLSACGQPSTYWELYMDGETLDHTFSLKGWCRERAMQMQSAYPAHTFECVEKRAVTDFWGRRFTVGGV